MARKENYGRRYSTEEWLQFMLEGTLEGEKQAVRDGEHEVSADCYDTVYEIGVDDIEISGDLAKAQKDFERDVKKAITEWGGQYRFREDVDADDIMEAGGAADVYLALDGSGAGDLNYGEWDQYFTDSDYWENETLIEFLKERVGKYIDDTGGGKLSEEMSNAVYEKFVEVCGVEENPSPEEKERRRQRAVRAEKAKSKRRKKRSKRPRSNNPATAMLTPGALVRELKF